MNWTDLGAKIIFVAGTFTAGATAAEEKSAWWVILFITCAGAFVSLGAAFLSSLLSYRVLHSKWIEEWAKKAMLSDGYRRQFIF